MQNSAVLTVESPLSNTELICMLFIMLSIFFLVDLLYL